MNPHPITSQLLTPLYASAAMRAVMSDRARLQRMLDFEAALARAEAAVGVITATGAGEIVEACQADRYNLTALVEAAMPSGNIAAAVVNALSLEVARRNKAAAGFVHWGATSQDMIDTALVLELRDAIDTLVLDLDVAIKGFTTMAGRHRRTLTVARTLMQQALPMPFGLRLAGYAAALARSRDRLLRLRRDALAVQFGGAAGTLAALGDRALGVSERLAALLDLPLPEAPWHSHRDRLAEVAANFAILAGTCGKIARDVAMMMQTEVGEVSEPPGRGGSSTLPHKRNPNGAAVALSAAAIAPNLVATLLAAQVQEQERGLGNWQTEWATYPTLALVTSGALDAVVGIAEGLEIDVDRMRENLERGGGRIMTEAVLFALAEKIGRAEAQRLVQDLVQRADEERRPLKDLLLADLRVKAQLTSTEIEKLFIPLTYQGAAQLFIDRLATATQARTTRRPETRPPEATRIPAAPQLSSTAEAAKPSAPPPQAEPVSDAARMPATGENAEAPPAETKPEAPQPPMQEATSPAAASASAPPAGEQTAKPQPAAASPRPAEDDAPGALMDVLTRVEAEARAAAAAIAEEQRKRS